MASKRKKPSPNEARRIELLRGALEFLMPEEQAEKAARSMWATWGSLENIVSAPESSLAAAPGSDANAARYLRLTLELARACLEEQADGVKRVPDWHTAAELFRPMYFGRRTEAVGVLLLDSGKRLLYAGIVCEGDVNTVPLYVRGLVRLCIDYNAASLLLAHNHTSGSVMPSQQDLLTTKQLELALGCIQVRLNDHIILTDSHQFSFFESGLLKAISEESRTAQRDGLAMARELLDRLDEARLD